MTQPKSDARRISRYETALRVLALWHEPWSAGKLDRWCAAAGDTPLRAEAVLTLLRDLLLK